jgi:hypothetical protein
VAADKGEDLVSRETFAKCIHELGFGDQCMPPQLFAGVALTVAGTTVRGKVRPKDGNGLAQSSRSKERKEQRRKDGQRKEEAKGGGGAKGAEDPIYRYIPVVEYEYFLELLDTEHGRQLMCKIQKPKQGEWGSECSN